MTCDLLQKLFVLFSPFVPTRFSFLFRHHLPKLRRFFIPSFPATSARICVDLPTKHYDSIFLYSHGLSILELVKEQSLVSRPSISRSPFRSLSLSQPMNLLMTCSKRRSQSSKSPIRDFAPAPP